MSPTRVFVRLKVRLVLNGVRRMTRSTWSRLGFVLSLVFAALAAFLGVGMAVGLRVYWDADAQHRNLVLITTAIVVGWWFAPILGGGVDETIDPARLSLLPLTRSQLRRGQIAAGFVGIAPGVMIAWVVGLVVGAARTWASVPFVVVGGAVVLLAALVGSRALSTSLARLSRSRRGGDVAAVIAVLGGSIVFAGSQLIRFLTDEQLDAATRVLRWSPPGMAGEAFELAGRGSYVAASWRIAVLAVVVLSAGWWWSRQLDRLLVEPARTGGASVRSGRDSLAIFGGRRRRLPHTAAGAAVARELIYLVRSPGRRSALLGGTLLGLVYVVIPVAWVGSPRAWLVLVAPTAMLLALQFASNQLGVDPAAFWIEVAAGPDPAARWVGRQLLGFIAVLFPVVLAALFLAIWTGGWVEFGVVLITMLPATLAMIGVGSLLSPLLVTPVPDSGNPFGGRQAMSGTGCSAVVTGLLYFVLVGVLIGPVEVSLRWAWRSSSPLMAVTVGVVGTAVNLNVWWWSTRAAIRQLPDRELEVLALLDARLNA